MRKINTDYLCLLRVSFLIKYHKFLSITKIRVHSSAYFNADLINHVSPKLEKKQTRRINNSVQCPSSMVQWSVYIFFVWLCVKKIAELQEILNINYKHWKLINCIYFMIFCRHMFHKSNYVASKLNCCDVTDRRTYKLKYHFQNYHFWLGHVSHLSGFGSCNYYQRSFL